MPTSAWARVEALGDGVVNHGPPPSLVLELGAPWTVTLAVH